MSQRTFLSFGAALLAAASAVYGCDQESEDTSPDAGADAAPDTANDAESGPVIGDDGAITFPGPGAIAGDHGLGTFAFGAATAATQIEDQNTAADWYFWTLPREAGGRGESEPLGDASQGFSRAIEDIGLMVELGLDTYRFSVDWARIEPQRDQVSTSALNTTATSLTRCAPLILNPT